MKQTMITGWDIGGAHLKVAQADLKGNLQQVFEIPCPLWQGIDKLHFAIQSALSKLDNGAIENMAAITMTGELADCFANRQTGVAEIIKAFNQHFSPLQTVVFAGEHDWLSPEEAITHWQSVASRNWQASANFVAQHIPNVLFIDMGSTTCDIIPIADGKATPQGFDDHQRQISRELLYTGTIRTPLIALANTVPFKGQDIGLAAEMFATTGDIWLLLDKLAENTIQDASADGKPWTKHHAAIRLARLLGTDADDPSNPIWTTLAHWFADKQCQLIISAIKQVREQSHNIAANYQIIGAGIGRSIISDCAKQLDLPYLDFSTLTQPASPDVADHAPAAAIALLAYTDGLWKHTHDTSKGRLSE